MPAQNSEDTFKGKRELDSSSKSQLIPAGQSKQVLPSQSKFPGSETSTLVGQGQPQLPKPDQWQSSELSLSQLSAPGQSQLPGSIKQQTGFDQSQPSVTGQSLFQKHQNPPLWETTSQKPSPFTTVHNDENVISHSKENKQSQVINLSPLPHNGDVDNAHQAVDVGHLGHNSGTFNIQSEKQQSFGVVPPTTTRNSRIHLKICQSVGHGDASPHHTAGVTGGRENVMSVGTFID